MTTNTERGSVTAEQALPDNWLKQAANAVIVTLGDFHRFNEWWSWIEDDGRVEILDAIEAAIHDQHAGGSSASMEIVAAIRNQAAQQPSVSAAEVTERAGTVVCLEGEGRDVGNVIWATPKPRPGTAVYLSAQSPAQTDAEGDGKILQAVEALAARYDEQAASAGRNEVHARTDRLADDYAMEHSRLQGFARELRKLLADQQEGL